MPTGMVIDVLRSLASGPDREPDGELVARFAQSRDPAAFAELVRRHGPTVFGVCRRVLGHAQDAEDAFQAVWLVLARRAADVRPPGAVGPWLYGVAVRTATKARALAMTRRHRQLAAARPEAVEDAPAAADLGPVLDEELAKLPERYRRAVVACDLNGRSRSQAARDLGWPEGTVAARVAKGRELLAARLRRRGVTLSSAALAAALASAARADLPPALAANAVAAALEFAAGAASAAVPPVSITLAEGVMRAMSMSRWKLPAVVLMTAGLAAGGAVLAATAGPPEKPRDPDPVRPPAVAKAAPVPAEKGPTVLKEHGDLVYSVAVHPLGKTIASGGADGRVIVRDAASLKKLWTAKLANPGVTAVAYSADGGLIAATHKDGVTLLDAATGKAVREIEEKGSDPHAVAFTPTTDAVQGVRLHKLVFANGRTTFVQSWAEGAAPGTVRFEAGPGFQGGDGRPGAPLAFSPDGQRVLMTRHGREGGKFSVWAWSAGSGVPNALLSAHTAPVYAAAWSTDGKRVATAGADGRVIVWDVKEGDTKDGLTFTEARRFEMPEGTVIYSLAFSPDGKTLAAGGYRAGERREAGDKPVMEVTHQVWRWDLAANKPLAALRGLPDEAVCSLVFSPDGKMLIAATGNPFHPRHPSDTQEERARRGGVHVWRLTPDK
jgi:RNA polymerase sigma factor (sigma-70 family)